MLPSINPSTTSISTSAMSSIPSMPSSLPRSRSSSTSSFDSSYFFKTYVPLSNLPTPPLSSYSQDPISPSSLFSAHNEILDPTLLGPALHLCNLIPSSASLITPSISHIHAILARASIPIETIALSVCILDSLNSRFALSWRQSLPLLANQHIDSVPPELIILSALILAVKFTDDRQESTRYYAEEWGSGIWIPEQINETQRIILENLGYKLLHLWTEKIIERALGDMERAGREMCREDDWDMSIMSSGNAVKGIDGVQLTPMDTPCGENSGTKVLDEKVRKAFSHCASTSVGNGNGVLSKKSDEEFNVENLDSIEEPFPCYVDPMVARGRFGF